MASASGREVAGGMEAEVLRLMHGDLIEHMNSKLMVETLWRREVVSLDVKKNIMRSPSIREGNRTLLRVLLQNVSITRFQRFLEVLEHSTDDHAPLILRFNNELAGLKGHPETLDVAVERRTPDIVKSLNNHYFSLIITDPFLQAPMNTFIPLQLVEPEGDHEGRDQSCIPLLAREGGEHLAATNTLVDYDNILNYPVYDRSKKFIMIVGERGSGKSTLARKMCWDFTSRVWGTEFVMVILVKCNQLPNQQGLQLEDLLAPLVGQTNQLVGQLAKYIKGQRNERILFILDGFDEMSRELQHNSPVLDIIHGRLVSNASYIVLTDPSCAPHISHVTNRCLYLAGFSSEGMRNFAQAYFKNVYTRNALVLIKALENRPRLRQILYKPECILSICFYLSGRGLPISITETTLYLMVILVNRHVELVLGQQSDIHEAEEIFEKCPSFKELGELALFGIEQNSTTFKDSDPSIPCDPAQLDHMGLLRCFRYRDVSGSTPEVFYFSNYGIHEYMAAYALTHNHSPIQQLEFWRKYFVNSFSPNGEFEIFEKRVLWCFLSYACQSGLRNEGIQQLLLETMEESFGTSITRSTPLVQLFDIANESQNVEFCRKVLRFVSPVVEIHTSRHGNPDLVDVHNFIGSLGWCLRHYRHLRGLHVTAPHLRTLAELLGSLEDVSTVQEVVFTSINPSTAEDFDIVCKFLKNQMKITCLKLDNVSLQSMELSLLSPVIAQHSLHLEEVQLRGTGDGSSSSLSEVMSHLLKCDKLRSLSLGSLEVGCNEIEQVLVRLGNLQELRIFDILSQDVNILNAAPTVDRLRTAVSRHPNLLTLDVGRSSEMMVKGLMEGISEGTALQSLTTRVSVNYLHSCIAQCLRRGHLRTLHLSVVHLTSTSEFMDLLSALPGSPVESLTLAMILTDNEVSKELAPCVERCLEQCVSLRRLSIHTSSNLSPVFCKALLRGAMTCNNLQDLELLGINFGHGDIVETLATYVRSCKVKRLAVGSKEQPCSGLFPRQIGYILAEGLLGNTLEECAIYASNEFRAEPDLKSSRYEDISQGMRSNKVIHRLVVACPRMALTNVAKGVLDGVGVSPDLPLRFLHMHLGEAVPEYNLGRLKGHRKLESYIVCPPRSR